MAVLITRLPCPATASGAVVATDSVSVDADYDNAIAAVPCQGGGGWGTRPEARELACRGARDRPGRVPTGSRSRRLRRLADDRRRRLQEEGGEHRACALMRLAVTWPAPSRSLALVEHLQATRGDPPDGVAGRPAGSARLDPPRHLHEVHERLEVRAAGFQAPVLRCGGEVHLHAAHAVHHAPLARHPKQLLGVFP